VQRRDSAWLGGSRSIQRVLEQVRSAAPTRAAVLIEGEEGTGKSRVARLIHDSSPRKDQSFVCVNCGALPEKLLEAELFGEEGGVSRRGQLESADQGTLFLDDIDRAPPSVQIKLLRVFQDRNFEHVGGSETIRTDVRPIAATRRDLAEEARAGRFREDLLYRLGVVRVRLPPLRERPEDIPILAAAFLEEFRRSRGRDVGAITRGALDRMMRYSWPGNVSELRSVLEGMVAFAEGPRPLDLSDLPPVLRDADDGAPSLAVTVGMTVEEAERLLIEATLRHVGQDKPRAASMLGIGLRTLYRKLQQYSIG
jgi:DNA-binding NtrC family response regulator